MMSAFDEVILEIDGTQMWSAFHVDRAISFAKEYGYSGIAFHCCELMDKVVFPSKFLLSIKVFTTVGATPHQIGNPIKIVS